MGDNIEKFRELLSKNTAWPMLYYFKFIIHNNKEKLEQVKSLFADPDTITYNTSKAVSYTHLTLPTKRIV